MAAFVPRPGRRTAKRDGATRRRGIRRAVALALVLVFLTVPELADASVQEVNTQRAAAGLPPLAEDGGLAAVAHAQAAQMAATATLAHSSNLAGSVGSVVPDYTGAAENVGYGASVSSVTSLFMTSPSHRSNILGNYNAAGVGVVVGRDGRVWVAQIFARRGGGAVLSSAVTRRVMSRRTPKCRVIRRSRRRVCRVVRTRAGRAARRRR